jgi:hypothetical protein
MVYKFFFFLKTYYIYLSPRLAVWYGSGWRIPYIGGRKDFTHPPTHLRIWRGGPERTHGDSGSRRNNFVRAEKPRSN